jgi:hypothetical protein
MLGVQICERTIGIRGCITWTSGARQLATGKVAVVKDTVSLVCVIGGNDRTR